jgi:hypothetical protein
VMNGRNGASLNSLALGIIRKSMEPDTTGKGIYYVSSENGATQWPTVMPLEGIVRFGYQDGSYDELELQKVTYFFQTEARIEVEAGSVLSLPLEDQVEKAIRDVRSELRYAK